MIVPADELGDGHAEAEAAETNGREGYQIDIAPDLRGWVVGARDVGTAQAEQVDSFSLFAACARGRANRLADAHAGHEDDAAFERKLFRQIGRPPRDMTEPDWQVVSREMKRKGVTLLLLWQEYREAHPDGFGYTWFCDKFGQHAKRANPTYRHRHAAGAVMQTDYAGQTIPLIDPGTGEVHEAQLFVAVPGASSYTFATVSLYQRLPDWIEGQVRALEYFGAELASKRLTRIIHRRWPEGLAGVA